MQKIMHLSCLKNYLYNSFLFVECRCPQNKNHRIIYSVKNMRFIQVNNRYFYCCYDTKHIRLVYK